MTDEHIITKECQLQSEISHDDTRKQDLLNSMGREVIAKRAIIAQHGHVKGARIIERATARAFPSIWNGSE